ncbi:MAG: hypothetical protein HWE07_13265 [Cytophagia bacterium]|nr:hypothetical protein [Cytophagia bacterium]
MHKIKDRKLFKWHRKEFNKVLIIQNNDQHAGFSALITYALNGIRRAKAINAIPIIDFNRENTPYFYDKSKGEDIWEYFFEKVSDYTPYEVREWYFQGKIAADSIEQITPEEAHKSHQYDKDRLATFWAWEKPVDKTAWMLEKRMLGRAYVQKYLKPKTTISKKVELFTSAHFNSSFIIGVHIRGTDFAYAKPTPIETYLNGIAELLKRTPIGAYQIYVATDQIQYLETFKKHYGDKVLSWNAVRSANHIAPFRQDNISGFQKGEDVLIDILLLSKCDHIFKGAAAVGEIALWFCDHNNITDFAIESDFYRKPYGELESTFSQLNLNNTYPLVLKLQRLKNGAIRRLTASRVGHHLFVRYAWVRKILRH